MSVEKHIPYRYYETSYAIINALIDAAFTACRYAQQPDESTEKYYDRRSLVTGIVQNTFVNHLSKALEQVMTAPEMSDSDNPEDDVYENGMGMLGTILYDIAKTLPVPAYELSIHEINKYFNSIEENITAKEQ